VQSILDSLSSADADYDAANTACQALFDQAILYAPADHLDSIREADFALRLVSQLGELTPEKRNALLPYLRQHPNLAQTLVFLIRSDAQRSTSVYALLDTLRQKRGAQLENDCSLAAAVCVVQNRPNTLHVNENTVTSVDPIDIFDYYVRNENRMYFGIRNVPAELLIHVVDTTASISEMQWALDRYAGNSKVGELFFKIKYDHAYLKSGGTKTLTAKGFNLQNILRYGGVCVDQCYFATTVGKAIGVPTAMDLGVSGEGGHAWVGFLQSNGSTGWWNFDVGRYQDYQGIQGTVKDPQTRRDIPDSYVSLLGEMIGTRPVDRQSTVALTDAAKRLATLAKQDIDVPAPPVDAVSSSTTILKPRARTTATQLMLIDAALRQSLAYTPAWFTVRDLATDDKLTLADKQQWADRLLKLGAKKYPEFTLEVLMPMVQTIDDPKQQDALLTNMLTIFAARLDLSARIRMAEAALWESQHQADRAGECYMDVVDRYCNNGPFVLDALAGAEKLLRETNRADKVLQLYQQAWARTKQPQGFAPEFVRSSNWFRIGVLYARKLTDAGSDTLALEVETQLGITSLP
jgi:hypothetical protein